LVGGDCTVGDLLDEPGAEDRRGDAEDHVAEGLLKGEVRLCEGAAASVGCAVIPTADDEEVVDAAVRSTVRLPHEARLADGPVLGHERENDVPGVEGGRNCNLRILGGARPADCGLRVSAGAAVSPRRLLEPHPDGPGELTEARRTCVEEVGHAVRVGAKIAVHEDVAEAAEPLELLPKRDTDHVVGAELGDDVFVILGTDAEVRAQDVVADVEDDLGTELEAAFHGPHRAKALAQRAGVEPTELREARDDLLEPQEALADRFGPKHHVGARRDARPPIAIARRGMDESPSVWREHA